MKACKCDVCGSYMNRTAVGVLYDNRVQSERKRYDLCGNCLRDIMMRMNEIVDNVKDTEEPE